MRRWLSIARATALEILSEPLSLLVLLAALVLATMAPAFHYHQFGEATRMARDAGFSALFTGGLVVAVFGTVRTFRREIETGTVQMALSHPVSRSAFFLSKLLGVLMALGVFSFIVAAVSLTVVNGAAIGGAVAERHGDIARLWGPSLALAVSAMLLPLVLGAALNRFCRCRFVLSAFRLALLLSAGAACYRFDAGLSLRLLPVAVLCLLPLPLFAAAAAAASVRLKANGATSVVGLLLAAFLPVVGNYYLPDALARGATLPWSYVALAAAVTVPALLAFLLVGTHLINGRDIA